MVNEIWLWVLNLLTTIAVRGVGGNIEVNEIWLWVLNLLTTITVRGVGGNIEVE